MAEKGGKWLGRFLITHPDHQNDLEQRAAELEFNDRLPRHEAEDRAYSEYKKETHYRGAAHHLRGLRAAQSSGDREDARKHDAMLSLHAKAAGFDPYQEVPAELHQYMHSEDPEPVHKFKAHRGDMLVLDDHKKAVEKSELQADLLRVLRKTELVLLLKSQGPSAAHYHRWPDGTPKKKTTDKCGTCGAPHRTEDHKQARHMTQQQWEQRPMKKGDVVPFPKDRIKPAVDQGKPASVVGRLTGTSKESGGNVTGRPQVADPLYKPGHRVQYNQDLNTNGTVGTVQKVHPGRDGKHMYYVKWDDEPGSSHWEDQLQLWHPK